MSVNILMNTLTPSPPRTPKQQHLHLIPHVPDTPDNHGHNHLYIPKLRSPARKPNQPTLFLKKHIKRALPRTSLVICFLMASLALLARYLSTQKLSHPFLSEQAKSGSTLLISIDGFRPDYLLRNVTPALLSLSRESVVAEYLRPSFPTITFPNHYTLVTGKYPSEHGIVSNTFFDPQLNQSFHYTDKASSINPVFWNKAEPIWTRVMNAGLAAAVNMWPGSEVILDSKHPTMYMHYRSLSPSQSIAIVTKWIDPLNVSMLVQNVPSADPDDWPGWPGYKRSNWGTPPLHRSFESKLPHFMALYLPHVDQAGHKFGPDSIEVNNALAEVDAGLSHLFDVIKALKLWDEMNIVVVSDHGMASTVNHNSTSPANSTVPLRISLRRALGHFNNVVVIRDRWPIVMLSPINPSETPDILAELKRNQNRYTAYASDDLPSALHYHSNPRIPPIVVIPENNYQFEDDLPDGDQLPIGMHGYVVDETEGKDMQAIFMARGPSFQNSNNPNSPVRVPAFDNVEVYEILCRALGIQPNINSGRGVSWM